MNFTMQRKYTPLSGRSFFARQLSRGTGVVKRVISRGLSTDSPTESTALPAPGTPGGAPSKTPYYIGAGVIGLLLLGMLGKRRLRRA